MMSSVSYKSIKIIVQSVAKQHQYPLNARCLPEINIFKAIFTIKFENVYRAQSSSKTKHDLLKYD